MSDKAKERIAAIGQQLNPNGLPAIKKVAGASAGPRVEGKVVIITGTSLLLTLADLSPPSASSEDIRVSSKKRSTADHGPPGTNSALGIGRAAAHQFAENGCRALYLCDFDGTHLEAHRAEIRAAFPAVDVHVRRFDAADEAAVKAVVDEAVAAYGRLDVFFANAGVVGPLAAFTDITDEQFMANMRTNVLR